MKRIMAFIVAGGAMLTATTGSGVAQIAVPNVNTGDKSNVPTYDKRFDRLDVERKSTLDRKALFPTVDPRCEKLTTEQRRTTPGCE